MPQQNVLVDVEPQMVSLKRDGFLGHVVGGYNGSPITRRDIVAYVANKAAGVHFDANRSEEKFFLIDQIRHCGRVYRGPSGNFAVEFDGNRLINPDPKFAIVSGAIDFVFLEFLATIQWILQSESVTNLFQTLGCELGV
ncbi:hypothetical protein WI94_26245 [Burkholderia vietnamiensis]|nr:hypothetical protein WI94_26245 [Burkholderia vietnamiensis]